MTRRSLIARFLTATTVALVFAISAPAAWAVDLDKARTFVGTVAEKGIQDVVQADIPHEEKIERFRSLFTTYFDVPSIARFVLGRYWRQATPEEQSRFVDLFQEVNIHTWARRFKDYSGEQLKTAGVQPDGDKGAFVDTMVEQTGGQQPLTVRWRLREREDGPLGMKVVDLEVEGVSMAITYRSEYASIVQDKGSVGALNDMLAQQLERLRGA